MKSFDIRFLCIVGAAAFTATSAMAVNTSFQDAHTSDDGQAVTYVNVLMDDDDRGDVFIRELSVLSGMSLADALRKPFDETCEGQTVSFSGKDMVMTADQDALAPDMKPETVFIPRFSGGMIVGEACLKISSLSTKDVTIESTKSQSGHVIDFSYDATQNGFSVTSKGISIKNEAKSVVLNVEDAGLSVQDGMKVFSLDIKNAAFVPGDFLYPDLVKRSGMKDPDKLVRMSFQALKSETAIEASFHADRIGAFDVSAEVDHIDTPMLSVFHSAEGSFKDEGMMEMFKAMFGRSLPDMIRTGDIPNAPEQLKSEKFSGMREAAAEWFEKPENQFSVRPETPVSSARIMAGFLISPQGLIKSLNITTNKENP